MQFILVAFFAFFGYVVERIFFGGQTFQASIRSLLDERGVELTFLHRVLQTFSTSRLGRYYIVTARLIFLISLLQSFFYLFELVSRLSDVGIAGLVTTWRCLGVVQARRVFCLARHSLVTFVMSEVRHFSRESKLKNFRSFVRVFMIVSALELSGIEALNYYTQKTSEVDGLFSSLVLTTSLLSVAAHGVLSMIGYVCGGVEGSVVVVMTRVLFMSFLPYPALTIVHDLLFWRACQYVMARDKSVEHVVHGRDDGVVDVTVDDKPDTDDSGSDVADTVPFEEHAKYWSHVVGFPLGSLGDREVFEVVEALRPDPNGEGKANHVKALAFYGDTLLRWFMARRAIGGTPLSYVQSCVINRIFSNQAMYEFMLSRDAEFFERYGMGACKKNAAGTIFEALVALALLRGSVSAKDLDRAIADGLAKFHDTDMDRYVHGSA